MYDVIVIGAGSGGLTAAVGFSKVGKSVLLVEREHMGGECTNSGCIPSKALLHHAKQYHLAKQISGETTKGETYATGAFTYVRDTIQGILADETPETFAKLGIDVVMGEAIFHSKHSITVGETQYTFKTAIIATGSSPRLINVPGLNETDILTNQNVFTLEALPAKTLIIGAGPIGMELGQAFAMLGSDVTIAAIENEFASLEDVTIRPILKDAFQSLGIAIHLNAFINRIEHKTAFFDIKDDKRIVGEVHVGFDKVLIAVGRVPNLPAGMPTAGIHFDERSVTVDTQHRTTNKNVYAIGDVAQRLKFTHTADDIARQVVTRVVSKGLIKVNQRKAIPKVTYTTPEIAQVGLSWDEAVEKYSEERIMRIEVPFTNNDRAKTDSKTGGILIVVAQRINGAILGAHIAGPAAGEILTLFTLAIDQRISLWKLQKLIIAYPTYSLIVKKAADQFVGRQFSDLKTDVWNTLKRHTPKIIAGSVWIAAIASLWYYQNTQNLTATQTSIQIFEFITLSIWGPLLYILIYAVRPVTFFPATALTILAGIFYGFLWGTLYTLIAATLAATVAYSVGRFFGSDLRLENTRLGSWVTALRANTFFAVLTTRLIFLPFDLLSYAVGILRAPFLPFIIATFFGIILGTATFVSIGASLDLETYKTDGFSLDLFQVEYLALAAAIFVISIGLSKILKRKQNT